jgi:hypothetical protein
VQHVPVGLLLALPADDPPRLYLGEAVEAAIEEQRLAAPDSHHPRQRVPLQEVPGFVLVSRLRTGAPPALGRVGGVVLGVSRVVEAVVGVVRVVPAQDGVLLVLAPLLLEDEVRGVEARQGVRVSEQGVVRRLRRQGVAHPEGRHRRVAAAAGAAPGREGRVGEHSAWSARSDGFLHRLQRVERSILHCDGEVEPKTNKRQESESISDSLVVAETEKKNLNRLLWDSRKVSIVNHQGCAFFGKKRKTARVTWRAKRASLITPRMCSPRFFIES